MDRKARMIAHQLEGRDIHDEKVLQAMRDVDREVFLPDHLKEMAYDDAPMPIGRDQTISQPYTVAFQTELLEVKAGEKVLEIGTGSGYQACVLVEMGAKVFSIERHRELHKNSKGLIEKMGYFPKLFYGDGYLGLPAFAPFDKILVTAGAPDVPDALLNQLNVGGTIVIPLGGSGNQVMTRLKKKSETEIEKQEFGHFRFVPLLGKKT